MEKVGTFGADGVILDLEDAVPVDQKVDTRAEVRRAIPSVKTTAPQVYVRINPIGEKTTFSLVIGMEDLEEVVCAGLDGLVVPKVESAQELVEIDNALGDRERKLGLPEGSIKLDPIIETALGLWHAFDIARSSGRIRSLHFGSGDFTRDVNIDCSTDEAELMYARSRLVVISRAASIEPPMDSVWLRLDDDEGLSNSARRAKRMGFQGKSCIHPRQLEIVNRELSHVSPEELGQAKKIVAAFAEAEARGSASILVDGQFVDYPIVEKAKRILELHAQTREGAG